MDEQVVARVKKPFQFYQEQFDKFMSQVREGAEGPLLTVFACHDMNGKVYYATFGPADHIEKLLEFVKREVASVKKPS